jgi:Protein of unknown function (DUF3606)
MNQPTHGRLPDTRRVELHDSVETPYWCKLLAVTEAHLTSAVETVGHRAEDVKAYLEREVERQELEREDAASTS